MKRAHDNTSTFVTVVAVAATLVLVCARPARAETWTATVGAQSADQGKQALAFLSNELWIHTGDSIRWTAATNELHTVSFLKTGQVRPPLFAAGNSGPFVGCPGATLDGSSFDGTSCVTSSILAPGQTYTVQFPTAGNYKLVCLVHIRMTGAVHVLNATETLPYDQAAYDQQAMRQQAELLADASALEGRGIATAQQSAPNAITTGINAITGTGGGSTVATVMRFLNAMTIVHVGDTVEWTNRAPTIFHTITFGTEPVNAFPPAPLTIPVDPDGVRHAVIGSPNDSVNSGIIGSPNQETVGSPQSALDFTRFRVTFTAPGTFNYICALHDDIGMKGTIVVHP
ncbi:MAG TPA: plastocyanin/azurin family copper-binding protein [Bryobacteraceae bacterium]|jgi:plastocyanin